MVIQCDESWFMVVNNDGSDGSQRPQMEIFEKLWGNKPTGDSETTPNLWGFT